MSLAELMSSTVIATGMGSKLDEDVYFTVFPFFFIKCCCSQNFVKMKMKFAHLEIQVEY